MPVTATTRKLAQPNPECDSCDACDACDALLAGVDTKSEREGFLFHLRLKSDSQDPNVQRGAPSKTFQPLRRSIELKNAPLLQALLEAGLDPNAKEVTHRRPLHHAAMHDFEQGIHLLHRFGAQLEANEMTQSTALNLGSISNSNNAIKALIDCGANVHSQNRNGSTALHWAAVSQSVAIMEMLVNAGADVNAKNKKNQTPLMQACNSPGGNIDGIRWLIQHGADVHAVNSEFMTPFMLAASNGNMPAARELLNHGADVNQCGPEGWHAIHSSAQHGRMDFTDFLIQEGVPVNTATRKGMTPLLCAVNSGKNEQAIRLLALGADVHAKEPSCQRTALHMAADSDSPELSMALIEAGAHLNALDLQGLSPKQLATQSGFIEWGEQMEAYAASLRAQKAFDSIFESDHKPSPKSTSPRC